jgi:hypothetical protein
MRRSHEPWQATCCVPTGHSETRVTARQPCPIGCKQRSHSYELLLAYSRNSGSLENHPFAAGGGRPVGPGGSAAPGGRERVLGQAPRLLRVPERVDCCPNGWLAGGEWPGACFALAFLLRGGYTSTGVLSAYGAASTVSRTPGSTGATWHVADKGEFRSGGRQFRSARALAPPPRPPFPAPPFRLVQPPWSSNTPG